MNTLLNRTKVLRRAAAILGQSVRGTDLIGRLGGDEFVLFAQGSSDVLRVHAAAITRQVQQLEGEALLTRRPDPAARCAAASHSTKTGQSCG